MSNLVIVAIPDENDRVWKVSSEKIPHLTLLYLGDVNEVANLDQIVQFVEHAANQTLHRFYLSVDRRGELGEDGADVLFFRRTPWDFKELRDFRMHLLQDNNIRTAYDSAAQHAGPFKPHLTLGYPDNPAKPDDTDRDFGFYDVSFTKIAVWTGDYEGPEFLLKDYWDEWAELESAPSDVAWDGITDPAELGRAVLEHYGTKGMKWGVRKVDGGGDSAHIRVNSINDEARLSKKSTALAMTGPLALASPRFRAEWSAATAHNSTVREGKRVEKAKVKDAQKSAKADMKWEKKIYTTSGAVQVHNAMAGHFNERIANINNKPEYKNNPDFDLVKKPDNDIAKKYFKEVHDLTVESYKVGVKKVHGSSPSGKKRAELTEDGQGIKVVDEPTKVKHAVEDEEIVFVLKYDERGLILEMNQAEETPMMHSVELGAEFLVDVGILSPEQFLEHFGIKGMRWGVRKEKAVTATERTDHGIIKRKTKVHTEGGEGLPAHDDAIRAAVQKQVLKKSGTDALSTQELRDLANRLQVEAQVQQLTSKKGKRFVQKQLEEEGKQAVGRGVRRGVRRAAPAVVKKASKGAATVATTAALL